MNQQDVIIVGAGLAGIAAAVRLAEAGKRVLLLETRKKLGGRATSFVDVRSGRTLDNCQHVVLGCCTNYKDLLARLHADHHIDWHREQYWVEAGGKTSIVGRGHFPAPAHFTGSMLKAAFLSHAEKLAIGRCCLRMLREDRTRWHDRTFHDFLTAARQPERAIRRFWSPVVVSACNLDVQRVAASSAMHVFQEGFLASPEAADIGIPRVPLADLYAEVPELLARAGGRLALGEGVERIDATSILTTDGRTHAAAHIICAVPFERVNKLIAPDLRARDPRFAPLERMTHSPILGVHLTFDRPVLVHPARGTQLPHAVLVDRPTQWLFAKPGGAGPPGPLPQSHHIHAVISAADSWLNLTEPQIADRILADIHACFPNSRAASLIEARAVKEKLATFAPVPGFDALRPGPTGNSGIILAGDFTTTGWPATMEGATRSGYAAAAVVLGKTLAELALPSLKVAPLAAALGLRAPAH